MEKVDKKVRPIPFKQRVPPKLVEGQQYFVSFGNNDTYPCTLVEIIEERYGKEVHIEIPMRPGSKKGFTDRNGKRSHNWTSSHILYSDEIGATREEAVRHTVG